jgi:hypothetical protein
MTVTRIIGSLCATNLQAITNQTADKIGSALSISGLSGVFKTSSDWNDGIMVAKTRPEENLTGFELISRLHELIHTEAMEELGLNGVLTMTTDTKRNQFKVTVKSGIICSEEMKSSNLAGHTKDALSYALYAKTRLVK